MQGKSKKVIGKVKYIGKDIFCSLTNNKIYDVEKITNVDGRIYLSIFDDDDQFNFSYMYDLINPHDITEPELCGKWELIESYSHELRTLFSTKNKEE